MARGATARLFVAVDPPPEIREGLAEWAREAVAEWSSWTPRRPRRPRPPPRLLKLEALHLTLCFLGSRPVDEIPALTAALSLCAEGVGELSVGAPLWLPPRRPRALAVEVQDRGGGLAGLHASVTATLSRASAWEPERRRFRPHITLVRMRGGAAPAGAQAGEPPLLPATPQLRFTPESIVLYRSQAAPVGTTYDALASCFLDPTGR
jgi:2'-5' RNA ligase